MYFLNLGPRVRFAAFKDEPEVEEELSKWLASEKTWEELPLNAFLSSKVVEGNPVLGIFFEKDNTFVTNSVGNPQVSFAGNPRSLLFVFGNYRVANTSGSFSYDKLNPEYFRDEISPHFYSPEEGNLQEVLEDINLLKETKAGKTEITGLDNRINKNSGDIARLSRRNDPLAVIMPVLAAEAEERENAVRGILQQLNTLQAPLATGLFNVTNYPTRDEVYDQLSKKTGRGYVDGIVSTKASTSELLNHINSPLLHENITYLQVGSPSRAEFLLLQGRLADAETKILTLEGVNPVKTIQGWGGLLATDRGGGLWRIDGSYVGVGTGDKPQEVSWYRDGVLALEEGTGRWRAWENATIIGVSATVSTPPQGGPVVIDIKKNGQSIYTTTPNRPTIPELAFEVLAPLPDDVSILEGDRMSVDIVNVGTSSEGSDLTVQLRYQYNQ